MCAAHFLDTRYALEGAPAWFQRLQVSFNHSVILDRHFLRAIEENVCIGSVVVLDASENRVTHYSNDYLRLVLERKVPQTLDFRELPCSLLRLYFSGRDRLLRWLREMPHWQVVKLQSCMQEDAFEATPEPTEVWDEYEILRQYVCMLLDLCFCSFERTLHYLLKRAERWPICGLFDALKGGDPDWGGFPIAPQGSILWLTCVWRIHITRVVETIIRPWTPGDLEEEEWVCYRLGLFRDTHLDLMTAMWSSTLYDDNELLEGGVLYATYPSCQRVCCAEELPCIVGFSFDNFKTGANLKERCSLRDKIGHLLINKPMNNICKVRNVHKIIRRYGNSEPVIFDFIKHISRAVLLGNVPWAKGRLNMMARLRVNLSFSQGVTDRVVPACAVKEEEEERRKRKKRQKKQHQQQQKKKKRRKRQQESEDDEEDDEEEEEDEPIEFEETVFTRWLYQCRHFILFILKEFLFYTAESSRCFDNLLSRNNKWLQYKEIVRVGMGECREEISRQCRLGQPMDWTRIEHIFKREDYSVKNGIIMKVHNLLLRTAEKVKKDSFENILLKKMTSIEEDIQLGGDSLNHLDLGHNGSVTLEELHFIAWAVAKRNRPRMETRWFQVLGMTSRGLDMLRDWLYCYYRYDIPDNALKKCVGEFQRKSMRDYIILKTMIKLVAYYKREVIFHLPASYAVRQTLALRCLLCLEPWSPTPAHAGICYLCPGCFNFANTIVNPVDCETPVVEKDVRIIKHKSSIKREPTVKKEEVGVAVKEEEGEEEGEEGQRVMELYSGDEEEECRVVAHYTNKKRKKGRKRKSQGQIKKLCSNQAITTKRLSSETQTKVISSIQHDMISPQQNIPFFNVALYDINTGNLHCQRNYKKNRGRVAKQHEGQPSQAYRVAYNRASEIVVESNLDHSRDFEYMFRTRDNEPLACCGPREVTDNPLHVDVPVTMVQQQEEEEEDGAGEGEDDAEEMITIGYENEIFFNPGDALNAWDMAARLTQTNVLPRGEALEKRKAAENGVAATGSTQKETTVPTNRTNKKGNKNKAAISKMVDAPIHRKYSCSSRLTPVDMVGIILNGKVLCVDCGCMTMVTNTNLHSYGMTCQRHATPSHPSDHPVWQIDRSAVKPGPGGRPPLSGSSSSDASKRYRQAEYHHPQDIVYDEKLMCHFCSYFSAILYVPVLGRNYHLEKIPICYAHRHMCKQQFARNNIPSLARLSADVALRDRTLF